MNLLHEQLALISTQFHWLRPWWLLSLIPIVFISILLWKQKRNSHQWQHIIAPELLPYLIDGKSITVKKSVLWALIIAWCISTIALAGPSWIKRPTPVEKNQSALVILLDLSTSMVSEDIKPSRIARARLKITDILRERKDGQTALVVYAGEAHTVTPLSDDNSTIISLLPSLQPNIMPIPGSNTEAAIERGIQLLQDAGAPQGDLLLITDGVVPEAFPKIHQLLTNKNIRLNILGVGTNQPAPIASSNGGFIRDQKGNIITTQLNNSELKDLAQQLRGRYSEIANTNSDINALMTQDENIKKDQPTIERDFDQWFDQGYWLVFLLLPIALFSFKRGVILILVCIPLMSLTPKSAYAFSMDDIWQTKDQKAQQALTAGDAKKAAEQFESPEWKASAQYRAGDYAAAAESFAQIDTPSAHYNRGNALAKSGDLAGAMKEYDEALKRDTNLEDAKKNRSIVEKALKQQKDQQSSDKNKQDSNDKNQKDKDQNNKDQNNKDQNQENQDKQNQEQQDSQNQQQDDKNSKSEQQKQENANKSQQNSSKQSDSAQDQQNGQHSQSSAAGNAAAQNQSSSANQQQSAAQQNQQQSSSAASAQNQHVSQSSTNDKDSEHEKQNAQQAGEIDASNLTDEQKQAIEQWLRRVPDDPGGLLRNKFRWQYQQNRQKQAYGEFEPPKNNADQRW